MSPTYRSDFLAGGKEDHLFMKKQVQEMKRVHKYPKPNPINLFE
jgi:hypothetical protein